MRLVRRDWLVAAGAMLLASTARAHDKVSVRTAFDRYRAAVTARDGTAALAVVTAGSIAHQDRLRELALTAPPAEVAVLPPADRLMVLRLRHEFTAEELRSLTGAELISIAVEEAWSSPKVLAPLTVAEVEQMGEVATLRVERAGEPVPMRLLLRREGGSWRLDLVELARGSDGALAETLAFRAARAKVAEDEVVRWVVEDTSGHLVVKDLWVPLEPGRN